MNQTERPGTCLIVCLKQGKKIGTQKISAATYKYEILEISVISVNKFNFIKR
jgi:hypothetical protein